MINVLCCTAKKKFVYEEEVHHHYGVLFSNIHKGIYEAKGSSFNPNKLLSKQFIHLIALFRNIYVWLKVSCLHLKVFIVNSRNDFFSRLIDDIHRCGRYGLGLAIDMIPICTCDSDQAPDLYVAQTQEEKESEQKNHQPIQPVSTFNEQCRKKLSELVLELVDSGDL